VFTPPASTDLSKLDNGRTTSFVVLQLQRDLTTAQLAELAGLTEYNKALAQLALREGSTLQKSRLDAEIEKSMQAK
jgi:hypothetical protein